MTYRNAILLALLALGVGVSMGWLITAKPIEPPKSAAPPVPASVESDFNRVTLKPEAEDKLNLSFGVVEEKAMPRSTFYGGEITIPPGQATIVSAPFSGVVQLAGEVAPLPAHKVTKGTPIFQLLPLLSPEGRANLTTEKVRAEGELKNAEAQLAAARVKLDLEQRLLMGGGGTQSRVNDAEGAFNLAEKMLEANRERLKTLLKIVGEAEKGTAAPITIAAPADGIIRNVSVNHEQNVPGGAPLFEILDLSKVWVRVSVYVGDRDAIDGKEHARIGSLAVKPYEKSKKAAPVAAPPSANPQTGSVDLFYQLNNPDAKFSPGERVGVELKLKSEAFSLTVPWGAILYDVNGGTWVYEVNGDHKYTRRRVQLHHIDFDSKTAVLTSGPPRGTKVVVNGAIELFGTETGYSK